MEIQTDFGSFKLDVTSRKAIYDQVEKAFCHMIKYYQGKTSFTSDKLAKSVADHFALSNRETVFRCCVLVYTAFASVHDNSAAPITTNRPWAAKASEK